MSDSKPPAYSPLPATRKASEAAASAPYPVQAPHQPADVAELGDDGVPVAMPCSLAAGYVPSLPSSLEAERVKRNNVRFLRYAPVMPLGLAIFGFVVNCVIPGFGTILLCFILPCVGHTVMKEDSLCKVSAISALVGFFSLLLGGLGIGYIAAIYWSYATIGTNRMYYKRPLEEKDLVDGETSMVVS